MKIIKARLTKKEVDERLLIGFRRILKGTGRVGGKKSGKRVEEGAKALLNICKQKVRTLEAAKIVKAVYEASKPKKVIKPVGEKKSGMVMTKCLGHTRKKCPECDYRLNVWGAEGTSHLACGRCGWNELAEIYKKESK